MAIVPGSIEDEAPAGDPADDGRHDEADQDADQAADERQRQGLDEELAEDVAALGAERLADADLAGPLADRHQHDVHDPDAPDDQRDRGDAAQQQGQRPADRRGRVEQLGLVEDREVVRVARADAMPHPEELGDRIARRLHVGAVRDADPDRPDTGPADEVLANRAQRHEHLVVGVLEARAALRLQDPDDLERDATDSHLRADRLGAEAEVAGGRGAEHDRAQSAVDGNVGQEGALPDLIGANGGVVGRGAHDRCRDRVGRARRDDGLRLDLGRDRGQPVQRRDCGRVVQGQRGIAATARGTDRQQVRAEAAQLLRDARRRATADAHERDHRRHADDHAEHRQRGADPAAAETGQGETDELQGAHAARSASTIAPSRRWTRRCATSATSGLWVIRRIVWPAAWRSWKS